MRLSPEVIHIYSKSKSRNLEGINKSIKVWKEGREYDAI